MKKFKVSYVIGIVIAVLAIILLINSIKIIPTGYTGVRTTFGQISQNVVQPGLSFKIPFVQSITLVNNKQQDVTFDGTINSETSERNEVFFSGITVTYQINAEKSSWIYANVSNYKNNLITESLVASSIKTASKTLTPTDVTSRNILEPMVKDNIQESLNEKYGSEVVKINKVVINNATFDEEYNDKIAQKQQAQMAYETQQIENKTSVEKAEADAKVKLTQAQADADARLIEAKAEAEANRLIQESLTDEVLKERMIEKWDGTLPKVTGENGMMLDVSDLMKDSAPTATNNTEPAVTE
ncbi:MAG: hypothetical protein K5776_03990 [Lachnospiraceae bacterium]|nr:hypothetical protein [Lachnospiraceae bacterium]